MRPKDRVFVSINLPHLAEPQMPDFAVISKYVCALSPYVGGFHFGTGALTSTSMIGALNAVSAAPRPTPLASDAACCVIIDQPLYGDPTRVARIVARAAAQPAAKYVSVLSAGGAASLEAAVRHADGIGVLATTVPGWMNASELAEVYGGDSSSNRRHPAHDPFAFALSCIRAAHDAGCAGALVPAAHVESMKLNVDEGFLLVVPDAAAPWVTRDSLYHPVPLLRAGADIVVINSSDFGSPHEYESDMARRAAALLADIEKTFAA